MPETRPEPRDKASAMMKLGKVLVFLNLFVAIALVTWATSLTANRLDWVSRTEGETKIEGEIPRLAREINALGKQVAEASGTYGQADRALAEAESGIDPGREGRDRRRAVFAARLSDANNGRFYTQLQIPNKVLIDVTRQGPAVIGPGGLPLEGVEKYQLRLENARKDGQLYDTQIVKLRQQFAELSAQIEDTDTRITIQREILANLGDEDKFLKSLQVNWDEDLRTLQTRQQQLQRRIESVKNVALKEKQ
jgi:peptidoglycan hydrolase CwlO-like protein